MELYCKVTSNGLVPLDDNDLSNYRKLKLESDVRVQITQPRNIKFHRKLFALLQLVIENMPDRLRANRGIHSVEALLAALKIDMGYFSTVKIDGRNLIKLKSISFAKMDEAQFSRFYDLAVTDILNNYLPGTNRNALLREVEQFISTHF